MGVAVPENLYDQLKQAHQVASLGDAKTYGVEIAIVTNVMDPEKQGRVKVCFPRLPGKPESDWARVVQPAAGGGRGFYWLPEVSDEVLVAFERGQVNAPYVLGALWNGKDKPMEDAYTDDNSIRMIQTKSGHQFILDDKKDAERIVLADKSGKRTLTFDVANKKLLVEAAEGDITLKAEKKIVLDCEDLEFKTSKTGKLDIGAGLNLRADQTLQIKAGPQLNLKGSKVNLNPGSFVDVVLQALEAAARAAGNAAEAAAASQEQQAAQGSGSGGAAGAAGGAAADAVPAHEPADDAAATQLSNPRWGRADFQESEQLEMLVDAQGLDGRMVRFEVQHRRSGGGDDDWERLTETTARIENGTATGRVRAAHPGTDHLEPRDLRFKASLS